MEFDFRAYQVDAEDKLLQDVLSDFTVHPVVALPTGTGKSKVIGNFIYKYLEEKPEHNIVVISHTEDILKQDYKAISSFFPEITLGLYSSGLKSKTTFKITIAGIQSVYRKPELFKDFHLCIIDECFTKGTLISTPKGSIAINKLKIGDDVYNSFGVGVVEKIIKKKVKQTIILELSNGKRIECTKSHKFFTNDGWVKAKDMEGKITFCYKDLRALRKSIQTTNVPLRRYSKRKYVQKEKILFDILCKERRESNAQPKKYRKDEANIEENRPQTYNKRGKWNWRNFTRKITFKNIRKELETRICSGYKNETLKNRVSNLLQNRYSKSKSDDRYRSRWKYSYWKEKDSRFKKRGVFKEVRVVSISSKKRESYETVYDLQVSSHPSYFANGALVHNCHTIPTKGNGMYQQLFKALPHLRRVGFTATHFRLGHGYIHKGEGALFNKLSVDYSSMDAFNNLIEDGYMSKLYNKPADYQLNVDGVKTTAGDYNIKDLSNKCDRQAITEAAVKQAVEYGHNYRSWLIFAINIEHAEHINSELLKHGIKSKVLHSKGREDRHSVTDEFKDRSIRAIVSVGMITTGFDAPNIDLIILLRPTKSPVLHIQMIGRGSRIHPNKEHCLILDFAGNIARLGPINCVQVPTKGKKKKDGRPIVKTCPICKCLHHPTVKICEVCGHVFTFKETIRNFFDNNVEVIRKKKESWMDVSKVFYTIHRKQGSPNSLKVTYKCGLRTITEWVCYDHSGYAGKMARHWLLIRSTYRGADTAIKNVQDLFRYSNDLKVPEKILVDMSNKYPTIKEVKFE